MELSSLTDAAYVQAKQELRQSCKQRRLTLSAEERDLASRLACERAWEEFRGLHTLHPLESLRICAYMPFGPELDILPLMHQLRHAGCILYIPRTHPEDHSLSWYHWTEELVLNRGKFGILEPDEPSVPVTVEELHKVDLILVPGLAFDRLGGRLGLGAGYYDRFLGRWARKGTTSPRLWSLIYGCQVIEHIPMESHDIPVDVIVTDREVIQTRLYRCQEAVRKTEDKQQ